MTDARYFNPYIIFLHQGSLPGDLRLFERMCLWYELELVTDGGRDAGVVTLDQLVPARPGTLFLRRPGDLVRGVAPYSYISVLFDVIYDPVLEPYYAIREASLASDVDIEFLRKYHGNTGRSFAFIDRIPRMMRIARYDQLLAQMQSLASLYERANEDFQFYAKALLTGLLAQLSRESSGEGDLFANYPPAVVQARDYIEANYMNAVTLESMAEHVSLNREYFCRLFKQHTQLTPMNYLQKIRIYHAKLLLLSEELSVEEIAGRCGFKDLSYFYAVFKKHTGLSPRQYKTQRPYGRITGGLTEK